MADASDSKSDVGDYVWVQVPSPARYYNTPHPVFDKSDAGCFYNER